tara:strand:+ start:313 stop:1437 length:1125 start_codon:yes stop_codon:yes gene_type:complete
MKALLKLVFAGFLGGVIAVAAVKYFDKDVIIYEESPAPIFHRTASSTVATAFDFTKAADIATPAVVHISASNKEYSQYKNKRYSPWDDFFYNRDRKRPQAGTGSGVIISEDGYIVTNNHVVGFADNIIVSLSDGREVNAKKIGTDPGSDLAVIKIEADDLSYLKFGNSDHVKVGEWVVAVGNPFNLESTVTAGIVSAKGRDLDLINQGKQNVKAIEEFIQTDAVVNPGNSGGALVDTDGNLIGINTAISSPTGYYAGYSFAIPGQIVKRVVDEIKENGNIQRAFLGVTVSELDRSNDAGLDAGVYVQQFQRGSSAYSAGIKQGDKIVNVNQNSINTFDDLQEVLKFAKVGDVLDVSVVREGKIKNIEVKLRNGI